MKQKVVRAMSLVGTMTIYLTFVLGAIFDLWEPAPVTGFWKILARNLTEAFPGGIVVLWLVCFLLLAVAYRVAENQFERVEAPLREREETP
jgi:hypothetical protein